MSQLNTNQESVDKIQPPGFHEGTIVINQVPTSIITFGGWIAERPSNKIIILVIPGNPGIIDFYQEFMETVYNKLEGRFPVWGISHAGHGKVPDSYNNPKLSGNEQLYSLQGQIDHKLDFVNQWIPEDVSLILIGHSIGCYIILQLMQHLPEGKILKSILLFPAIERLSDTFYGKLLWPVVAYLHPLAFMLVYSMSYLPPQIQYKVTEWFFNSYKKPVPSCVIKASLKAIDAHCVSKGLYMGRTEMEEVVQLDLELIRSNIKRLIFYYGFSDHWSPVEYYENLRECIPEGEIRLCDRKFEHAFVFQSGVQVGEMVSEWVAKTLDL